MTNPTSCPAELRAPAGAVVDAAVLGRALGVGAAVTAACAAVAAAVGLLPEGVGFHVALGVAAALLAAVAAVWIHGRFLDARRSLPFAHDGRLMASRIQGLLAAAFGVKLAVLLVLAFVLLRTGAKFAELATFCVTFAAASLVCQLATAWFLSRALQAPRRATAPASEPPPPS